MVYGEYLLLLYDIMDFDDVDCGFIVVLFLCVIKVVDGCVVWDNDVYLFFDGVVLILVYFSLWW